MNSAAAFRDRITVLILTFNEAANIGRTLDAVHWARRIVIIDSGSTDDTIEIARRYPQAEVVTRPFDNHQAQWNFGLSQCGGDGVRDWVLALDADYQLTDDLSTEIAGLDPPGQIAGYRVAFRYCIDGHVLRASLYPPVIALFRLNQARYIQQGHTQRLVIDGPVLDLDGRINHDDRKPLAHWLVSQLKYARLEAEHILAQPRDSLRKVDRLRLMAWPMPLIVLPYTLLAKRCILDGRPGWVYALQRLFAEVVLALEIADRRLRGGPRN